MGISQATPAKQGRRSFSAIRLDLLAALSQGRTTVNELSRHTGINWKTVDNHLIYLCGRGWAEKVFDSPYVKIFDITPDGSEHLERVLARASRDRGSAATPVKIQQAQQPSRQRLDKPEKNNQRGDRPA